MSTTERNDLEDLEAEIEADLPEEEAEEEAEEGAGRGPRTIRGVNWRMIYLGGAGLLAVLLGVALLDALSSRRTVQPTLGPAQRDRAAPVVADPPYADVQGARSRSPRGDSLGGAPVVPPPSSAVVGGRGGRDYRTVQSGDLPGDGDPPAEVQSASAGRREDGSGEGAAGGAPERPRDPRREAWAAARDEVPESGWGATAGAGASFGRIGEEEEPAARAAPPAAPGDAGGDPEALLREAEEAFGLAPGALGLPGTATRGGPSSEGGMVVPGLTAIPAFLVTGINSESTGEVIAQVTQDVFDRSGRRIAIPRGSRFSGRLARPPAPGDARVDIGWNLLRFPDRTVVAIPSLTTADRSGAAGIRARVDHHYGRTLGAALVGSVLGAGLQLSQPRRGGGDASPGAGQIGAGAVGQQLAQVGGEMVRRELGIRPTATVAPGTALLIMVREDLVLPPARR